MMDDCLPLIATFQDRKVVVRRTNGTTVRIWTLPDRVVNVQVSDCGMTAMVSITMANGHWIVYRCDGTTVRRG